MTIGDLFDLLQEKLKTGEFHRMDSLQITGNSQNYFEFYPVEDLVKTGHETVLVEIDGYINEFPAVAEEDDDAGKEEMDRLEESVDDLREILEEAVDYLDGNKLNSIGSGSELHREFKRILKETE